MKTHTIILALSLVAFSFNLQANSEEKKENEESSTEIEILEIVDTEDLKADECVACPVPVQIFDQEFNLILTGEMTPMEEISSQELRVLIGQSNLIMESSAAIIYQLEE
ncbi:MAG: hypothetical protein ABJH98_16605 [Reichenbachiella sp.]|uniref:hypothetical protein n=1 Tax=Reichenbachiella sp. TaxID=2184521 RepID=UPI00329A4464